MAGPGSCGCDESKQLKEKLDEADRAYFGVQAAFISESEKSRLLEESQEYFISMMNAEKSRLLEDLINCERKLAKMTAERDDYAQKWQASVASRR